MYFLKKLIKGNRIVFTIAAILGLLSGGLNARLIALVSQFISKFNSESPFAAWPLFALLVVAAFLTGSLTQVFMSHLSAKLTFNLRLNICQQILALPYRHREKIGHAKMMAAFTEDIQAITRALLRIPNLFVNATITIGCLVYLGYLSLPILGALIGFIIFGMLTYKLPERFALKFIRAGREGWDQLITQFNAILAGDKELALHYQRRKAMMTEKLNPTIESLRSANFKERSIYAFLTNWSRLIYFVFIGLLLFFAPQMQHINSETLIGFTLILMYVRTPIIILVDGVPLFRRANVAVGKIEKLGIQTIASDYQPESNAALETQLADPVPLRSLVFKDVTHAYYREKEDRFFKLGPIDFSFQPGEIIFLIGGNGSGKTTLAKLITGLYPPESGDIYLNGQPLDEDGRESYRQHFTAIFTDFFLFEQLLGLDPNQMDERANQYLKELQLDHKVTFQAGELSTTALSTGQRKRLALITAFLEDRPIYLFDEWAADQDPEFKKVFYRQLLPELKAAGKLVFVISHDDRYFDVADQIIKLTDGQVTQAPTLSM